MAENQINFENAIVGSLIGTTVGDAFGLPFEGLPNIRQQKFVPNLEKYHLLFGKGMCSDDTEHACMTAQALISAQKDSDLFSKLLSKKIRWWFLSLPAGIGLATLRSCIKLCLDFKPDKSGVKSAGNGPAMRAPIIGVYLGNNKKLMIDHVIKSTRLTHTDIKAQEGALVVALAAHLSSTNEIIIPKNFLNILPEYIDQQSETFQLIQKVVESVERNETAQDFANSIGCHKKVTGYMLHTVPLVIHVWLNNQTNYLKAITEIIRLGGDTDTTAAILGGIIGARVGKSGIPKELQLNIIEWPRTITFVENVGKKLAKSTTEHCNEEKLFLPGIFIRNIIFFLIILAHGLRRLLPPY